MIVSQSFNLGLICIIFFIIRRINSGDENNNYKKFKKNILNESDKER